MPLKKSAVGKKTLDDVRVQADLRQSRWMRGVLANPDGDLRSNRRKERGANMAVLLRNEGVGDDDDENLVEKKTPSSFMQTYEIPSYLDALDAHRNTQSDTSSVINNDDDDDNDATDTTKPNLL
jgi:hypothetical protein